MNVILKAKLPQICGSSKTSHRLLAVCMALCFPMSLISPQLGHATRTGVQSFHRFFNSVADPAPAAVFQ